MLSPGLFYKCWADSNLVISQIGKPAQVMRLGPSAKVPSSPSLWLLCLLVMSLLYTAHSL